MKKKTTISIMIILAVLAVCGILFYNYMFPRAESIMLPKENEVTSIRITIDDESIDYHKKEDISKILEILFKAKPTRNLTVHDRPMVREFYTITFLPEDDSFYRTFIYIENSKLYLEQPYHGIYILEDNLIDYLPKK